MPSYLAVIGGWTVVIGGFTALYFLNKRKKRRRSIPARQSNKSLAPRKDNKVKKARLDGGHISGDQEATLSDKPQRKRIQNSKLDRKDQGDTSAFEANLSEPEDDVDNREFARQLSSAKAGTLLPSKSSEGPRHKSVKQSRAQEKASAAETSSDNATAQSSVTGGDADDDQSSINSPELGATMATPPTNGDVSDMLETPSAGPSVLKVTESSKPAGPKKAKAQSTFEPVETKKQRQNRKKAETKKSARVEDEQERKLLLEQQRRTVREAEGRPAKDGSAFMAAQAPSTSAWKTTNTAINGGQSSDSKNAQLLDTFDAAASKPKEPIEEDVNYSQGELLGSAWQQYLPSEEEQLKFVVEESKNWNIVKAKEKRNKKAKEVEQQSKGKSSSADEEEYGIPKRMAARSGPGQTWTMTTTHVENGKVVEKTTVVQDSEWEVA